MPRQPKRAKSFSFDLLADWSAFAASLAPEDIRRGWVLHGTAMLNGMTPAALRVANYPDTNKKPRNIVRGFSHQVNSAKLFGGHFRALVRGRDQGALGCIGRGRARLQTHYAFARVIKYIERKIR